MRNVVEIALGLLFGVGAAFNTVYTLSHGDEFYGSFAEGAWLAPARGAIEKVVLPNATLVTILVILVQLAVAVMILTRGDLVVTGLVMGAGFAFVAALASSPGGTVGNLALAAIQLVVALGR